MVPRRGVFTVHRRRETTVVDTNTTLVFGAGEPYRVGHPAVGGDECTVFVFAPEVIGEPWVETAAGSVL